MYLFFLFLFIFIAGFTLLKIHNHEKLKTVKQNYNPMQAKRILNLSDLKDNRKWFISRFNESETYIVNAQASCKKRFDYKSIVNLSHKFNDLNRDNSSSN